MMLAAPETLVISSKEYGAFELKKIIKVFTLRGFYYVMAFLVLCIIAVFAFSLERELFWIRKFLSTKIASFLSLDNKCLLMSMLSCTFIISNNHDLITIDT